MKRLGIYSGMLDPLHNGHLWVIEQVCRLFDEVHIVIGPNPKKEALFTEKDRLEMLDTVLTYPKSAVKTLILPDRNLAEYANKQQDDVAIIRGIRNSSDFEYEESIVNCMRTRAPDVQYLYVIPPKNLRSISSSFIKSLCEQGWWSGVEQCVPHPVFDKLAGKWHADDVAKKIKSNEPRRGIVFGGTSPSHHPIIANDIEDIPGRGIFMRSSSGHTIEMEDLFNGYEPNVWLENQRAYFDKAMDAGLFQMAKKISAMQVRKMLDPVPFDVVASEVFHLCEIPISGVVPTGERYLPCSKSLGPIIVDVANPGLPDNFKKKGPVLILEGKHRWLDARERGEKRIWAWVGERAMSHLGL